MRNQIVRIVSGNRLLRVGEGDTDDLNAGGPCSQNVRLAVTDHDGALYRNAEPLHRFQVGCGIRLGDIDGVGPDDRPEIFRQVERLQKPDGKPFQLVGDTPILRPLAAQRLRRSVTPGNATLSTAMFFS